MGAALRLPRAVFSGRLTTNFMCRSSTHDDKVYTKLSCAKTQDLIHIGTFLHIGTLLDGDPNEIQKFIFYTSPQLSRNEFVTVSLAYFMFDCIILQNTSLCCFKKAKEFVNEITFFDACRSKDIDCMMQQMAVG